MNPDLQHRRELSRAARLLETVDHPSHRLVDGLRQWSRQDPEGRRARLHRIGPCLALQASTLPTEDQAELDPGALQSWRRRLRAAAAQHMHLEAALEQISEQLGDDLPWAPIKGMDLAYRVYRRPEERPTSDLDILIHGADLERARTRLTRAGWRPLHTGRRAEAYLQDEGYAWQARNAEGALLELHHRLWAWIHPDAAGTWLGRARPPEDSDQHGPEAQGLRLQPADAYLVAAVHLWLDAAPRPLIAFRDLERLATTAQDPARLAQDIAAAARDFDLQLPVVAAARVVRMLWKDDVAEMLVRELDTDLSPAERRVLPRELPESASLSRFVLARHLSRRTARHGLAHALRRRVWAHPGIVEVGSPDAWPWWARRLAYQTAAAGSRRLYPIFDKLFARSDPDPPPARPGDPP